MQRLGRCPQCGYPLRFNGREYSCDFCGYPGTRNSFADTLRRFEANLRSRVNALVKEATKPFSRQVLVYYPVAVRPCLECGLGIPYGVMRCPHCGTTQEAPRTTPSSATDLRPREGLDERVYNYIIAHNGTISLSQTSRDLQLPPDALQAAIDRLKTSGLLSQS